MSEGEKFCYQRADHQDCEGVANFGQPHAEHKKHQCCGRCMKTAAHPHAPDESPGVDRD